ncbi:Mitotic spindle checkpoint component mad2 [Orbilia ellipsospora]|uniref:Mitotic spindle checkpoint component mad2 n=1 Tax=Orbilia ellipsospora TaxID=2528407 RepID=A0AAV9WU24_9PEZI
MPTDKPVKKTKKAAASAGEEGGDKVHKLTLKGSAKMVSEFFEYSIHSILFQRGVYPPDDFAPVKKYGLNMLVNTDDQVKAYIKKIMSQLSKWMLHGKISKFILVISDKDTGDKLERWQFDVHILGKSKKSKKGEASDGDAVMGGTTDKENSAAAGGEASADKTEKEIQEEIQSIFRQITASVTFLPMLDNNHCTFNVLVYADGDAEVPMEWGDGEDLGIQDAEQVQLRSWSSSSHRVETMVSYRIAD